MQTVFIRYLEKKLIA